ncbi:putative bifunctional diguanylate cyclase/phosphodiesterase [Blastococcus sp. SYSU D00813]
MKTHGPSAPAQRRPVLALYLNVGLAVLFATGVWVRPAGDSWDRAYDVVLFNLPYLAAAWALFAAGARVRIDRLAWWGLGVALSLSAVGNALRVLAAGVEGNGPSSPLANLISLAGYLTLYVFVVGVIKARVPRFHPSMWLDGLITALGSLSLGIALVLGPYLIPGPGETAVPAIELTSPTISVVLLAMLAAVGSILGMRMDRTLVLVIAGLVCVCASDLIYFTLSVRDAYVDGGPLELGWLAGVVLAAVAATIATDRPAPVDRGGSRIGWRLLVVPLACIGASLFVLGSGWTHPIPPVCAWLAIACVVAGIARIAVTFHEVRSFHQVKQESRTDELTGLPNRRALLESAQDVVTAAAPDRPAALLLLDLDGFKEVNDSLGHSAGDELLRQIGPRLRRVLRTDDVLARLGGDEFAVLLPTADAVRAQALAERLRELLLEPFMVTGIRLHVGVSVGVATTPAPASTVQELLHCADVAMYSAKAAREGVHVYVPDPVTGTAGSDRLRTMEELRTALEAGDQLVVFLQPQMDLRDGAIVGAEALVRWNHPTRGLLSPAHLLPAAEQAGLLRPLTDVVLELALAATTRWWNDRHVPVSVNLSAANVTDLDLPEKVAAALRRHGLPTEALTLELVEDTLMADPERGRAVLADLRQLGVRTSIDDYGTGYSSLAYLRHLPADELKIDRSLTADVDRDPRAAAIVRHTVALAHDLGLHLVAEGVETASTSAALARLGCDVAQGYGIARPMPVDDFLVWLSAADAGVLDPALLRELSGGVASA